MQSENKKYLIDIYFDEGKMKIWKDRCEKSQQYLKEKFVAKSKFLLECSKRLNDNKEKYMETMKNSITERNSIFSNIINNYEAELMDLVAKTRDDANLLYKQLEVSCTKDSIQSPDLINFYHPNSVKERQNRIIKIIMETDDEVKKIKELVIKNMSVISTVLGNLVVLKNDLTHFGLNITKYDDGLKRLEEDYDYLSNPSMFPKAYESSLVEARRRILFNRVIMSIKERMSEILNKENECRRKFIREFGKYLTNDYLPSLKLTNLSIEIKFDNKDELTQLPEVLIEDDLIEFNKFQSALSKLEVKTGTCFDTITNTPFLKKQSEVSLSEYEANSDKNKPKVGSNMYREMQDSDGYIRIQKVKTEELEQKYRAKEQELKRLQQRIEERDKKILSIHIETEKFVEKFEKATANLSKQVALKDLKIDEKMKENADLLKQLLDKQNKPYSCLMCKFQISKSTEYSWSSMLESQNSDISSLKKQNSDLDNMYRELSNDFSFVKTTILKHLGSMIASKNNELNLMKDNLERKEQEHKDNLSSQKQLYEEEVKYKVNFMETSINEMKRELLTLKKELEVKSHINNKLQQEVNESKEKCKYESEKSVELQTKLEQEQKRRNDLEKVVEEMSDKSNYQTDLTKKLEREVLDLQEQIVNIKRSYNKANADLKAEVLRYSELCDSQDSLLKEKSDELERRNFEFASLEDKVENFRFLKNNEMQNYISKIGEIEKERNELRKKVEDLENLLSSGSTSNNNANTINLPPKINNSNFSKKQPPSFHEISDITKISHDNFFFEFSSTKLGSTENNCLTNNYLTNLTKVYDDMLSIKKLDKGVKCVFVPYSEGIYIPICLNQYESDDENKVFRCSFILNIDSFEDHLKELIV